VISNLVEEETLQAQEIKRSQALTKREGPQKTKELISNLVLKIELEAHQKRELLLGSVRLQLLEFLHLPEQVALKSSLIHL